jgi:hypothetical protein
MRQMVKNTSAQLLGVAEGGARRRVQGLEASVDHFGMPRDQVFGGIFDGIDFGEVSAPDAPELTMEELRLLPPAEQDAYLTSRGL